MYNTKVGLMILLGADALNDLSGRYVQFKKRRLKGATHYSWMQ